jgi:ubiquinone/menaquinone biosynthesis C-methylase UbiE
MTDHLAQHLCSVPAHRALVRAQEAALYDKIPLTSPILDVGCGDGYFARATFSRKIDIGIDASLSALAECARTNTYTLLLNASGAKIPFPDATFATAISNCVLEHIPDIDQALCEISRVLKPGGLFVGTMVTDQLASLLGIPRLLQSIGLTHAADAYATWFNRKARHYHMLSPTEWSARLANAGLEVTRSQYYLGPKATLVFDLLHYYALPSAVVHRFFRRWLLWQDSRNVVLTAALLRGICDEGAPEKGACVFVTAVRKADSLLTTNRAANYRTR